jgi:hypothetical protein
LDAPGEEEGVGVDEKRVGTLAHKRCEGRIDLAAGVGLSTWTCSPMARAPAAVSLTVDSEVAALEGLTSTAARLAAGTISRRSSRRFAANSFAKLLIPVRLPPGWARLATRPSLTGSSPTLKTMGIVVVAARWVSVRLGRFSEAAAPNGILTRRSQQRFGCPKFNSIVQKLDSNHAEGFYVLPDEMITERRMIHVTQIKSDSYARWQRAAELLLAEADVGALTKQVELALFFEAKLDPTAKA